MSRATGGRSVRSNHLQALEGGHRGGQVGELVARDVQTLPCSSAHDRMRVRIGALQIKIELSLRVLRMCRQVGCLPMNYAYLYGTRPTQMAVSSGYAAGGGSRSVRMADKRYVAITY